MWRVRIEHRTSHSVSISIILDCLVTDILVDLYERATASGKTVPISSSSSVNTRCVLC
jgi:hypothetical protein